MRVLITAGGTTELIDTVRGISNFATGQLGKLTAEAFAARGHEVILLRGRGAVRPEILSNLTEIEITGTQDLFEQMKKLVPQVDVVVHSMAVSDYRPVYMTDLEQFPSNLTKEQLLNFSVKFDKKISSKPDHQIMLLEKTPKIISYIKEWQPQILLFGFKLLSGVTETELIEVAQASLKKNRADFIIANDLENIHGEAQRAILLSNKGQKILQNKPEIAAQIVAESENLIHD